MNRRNVLASLGALTLVMIPLVFPNILPFLFPSKHYYNARYFNGELPLRKINIQIVTVTDQKGETLQFNKITDSQASIIVKLKDGVYSGIVIYNNKSYPYNFYISNADKSEVIDISNKQVIPKTANGNGIVSTTKVDTLAIADVKKTLKKEREKNRNNALSTNQSTSYAVITNQNKTAEIDAANPVQQDLKQTDRSDVSAENRESINEDVIIKGVNIHVRRSEVDKNEDGQIAYHYYLTGTETILNSINTVYYKRNHATFSEYSGNKAQTSSNRATNFDFKGYQWGYISDTYLAVTLINGTTTNFTLKQLIYDN